MMIMTYDAPDLPNISKKILVWTLLFKCVNRIKCSFLDFIEWTGFLNRESNIYADPIPVRYHKIACVWPYLTTVQQRHLCLNVNSWHNIPNIFLLHVGINHYLVIWELLFTFGKDHFACMLISLSVNEATSWWFSPKSVGDLILL